MARPKRPPRTTSAAAETPDESEKLKNLYDLGSVRHKLDETVSKVVEGLGYREKTFHTNVKIALGLIAIGVALYAQFGPGKFPANWWTTFACVVLYIVASAALTVYSQWAEGDAFLITHPAPGQPFGLRVSSRMERYSDMYHVRITTTLPQDIRQANLTKSITQYFHEDGYIAEDVLKKDVEGMLEELLQKKSQ